MRSEREIRKLIEKHKFTIETKDFRALHPNIKDDFLIYCAKYQSELVIKALEWVLNEQKGAEDER